MLSKCASFYITSAVAVTREAITIRNAELNFPTPKLTTKSCSNTKKNLSTGHLRAYLLHLGSEFPHMALYTLGMKQHWKPNNLVPICKTDTSTLNGTMSWSPCLTWMPEPISKTWCLYSYKSYKKKSYKKLQKKVAKKRLQKKVTKKGYKKL